MVCRMGLLDRLLAPARTAATSVARVVGPSPFPPDVRLKWATAGKAGNGAAGRRRMIGHCLREPADGDAFYRIAGRDHHFHPHFAITDEAQLRQGVELILREAYLEAEDEPPEVRARRGDVVLDLGGNIGTRAMQFAAAVKPGGRVYAFEPVIYAALEKNAKANGFGDAIRVERLAVGDTEGTITFAVRNNCIDSRIGSDRDAREDAIAHVEAEVVTLDGWAERRGIERVDLVKIDIEGAEEMALRGGERVIRQHRPRLTISSYHTDPAGDKQHPKLVALLKEWGYHVVERDAHHIFAWMR